MRTRRSARLCGAVIAFATGAALLVQTAAATPPQDAGGMSFLTGRTVTSVRQADGHTFLTIIDTRFYVGTISGTSVDTLTVKVDASGAFSFHGFSTCTCAIAGRPGTVVMNIAGKGEATGEFADHRETLSGSATGALEGVHLNVSVAGVGGVGAYSGTYHFDP
jgi:hypothetical protein